MRYKISILVTILPIIISIFLDKGKAEREEDVPKINLMLFQDLLPKGYTKQQVLRFGKSVLHKVRTPVTETPDYDVAEAQAGADEFTRLVLVDNYPMSVLHKFGKAGMGVQRSNLNFFRMLIGKGCTRTEIEQHGKSADCSTAPPTADDQEAMAQASLAGAVTFTNLILSENYPMHELHEIGRYGVDVKRSNLQLYQTLLAQGYPKVDVFLHGWSAVGTAPKPSRSIPQKVDEAEALAGAEEFNDFVLVEKIPLEVVQKYGKSGVWIQRTYLPLIRNLMAKGYTKEDILQYGEKVSAKVKRPKRTQIPVVVNEKEAIAVAAVFTHWYKGNNYPKFVIENGKAGVDTLLNFLDLFRRWMKRGYTKEQVEEYGLSVFDKVAIAEHWVPRKVDDAEAMAGAKELTSWVLQKKYPLDKVQKYGKFVEKKMEVVSPLRQEEEVVFVVEAPVAPGPPEEVYAGPLPLLPLQRQLPEVDDIPEVPPTQVGKVLVFPQTAAGRAGIVRRVPEKYTPKRFGIVRGRPQDKPAEAAVIAPPVALA